jgi:putative dimethyl sulfoxide reductase chaperone
VDRDLERAEFYLCLARSYLPPEDADTVAAMREHLAEDLEALCDTLAYQGGDALAQLRSAMAAYRRPDDLATLYSRLFVAPPRLAYLNSGVYLDGGLIGPSVQAMKNCYRMCGVERTERFPNGSDHVSVQLEFLAYLYAARPDAVRPEHFLHSFPRNWLPGFIAHLQAASDEGAANPYLALARLLESAVKCDASALPRDPRDERHERALKRARHNRAASGITPDDLRIIEARLKAKGLSTEHLSIPPERDLR